MQQSYDPNSSSFLYAGFGPRFASLLLDVVCVLPLLLLNYCLDRMGLTYHAGYVVFSILFFLWYHIYLVAKFGGTPGKLMAGLKIVTVDLQKIGWKEAILRHSVETVVMILTSAFALYAVSNANNDVYLGLPFKQQTRYLTSLYPSQHIYFTVFSQIWYWSELIVLLTNSKKRALHDFIAGTVVVNKAYFNTMEVDNIPPNEEPVYNVS